jgi:hypothetical protein
MTTSVIPRSQTPFGNARVRATPLPQAAVVAAVYDRRRDNEARRSQKNPRHPERSEANGPLSPSSFTRAQSKDLADFASGYRSGTESFHAGPARRHGMKMPFGAVNRAGKTTRSFDRGSATLFEKTNALLASAQDDGVLNRALSSSTRSQTPFGNALVPATSLPQPVVVTAVYDRRSPSTPTGLKNTAKGWRSSAYLGSSPTGANPERVALSPRPISRPNDSTPTGLGRFSCVPRVAALPQPSAIRQQPFQGCPKAAGIGNGVASASAFPNGVWERAETKPRPQKNSRHPERSEANGPLSPSSFTRARSKVLADFASGYRSGTESFHAGLARRHEMKMPSRATNRAGKTTRSFDCGSANAPGETKAPLASAQDDGVLEKALSQLPPSPVYFPSQEPGNVFVRATSLPGLGKPEACHNPSRWLSPRPPQQRAPPPVSFLTALHPGRGATTVRPLPGSIACGAITGGVARCGLNHRLGLCHPFGMTEASHSPRSQVMLGSRGCEAARTSAFPSATWERGSEL